MEQRERRQMQVASGSASRIATYGGHFPLIDGGLPNTNRLCVPGVYEVELRLDVPETALDLSIHVGAGFNPSRNERVPIVV
jgi:hypothetical protein